MINRRARPTTARAATVAAATLLAAATPARALVIHSTGDPTFNTTAPTGVLSNSGWQYQGINGSHLGTPVGPHHFLTAAHLNNPVGSTFTYHGVNYTSTAVQDFGDLRLFTVGGTFHSYAPLYESTDTLETLVSTNAVVIGRGRTRGDEARVGGILKGWQWGASDSVQRWGENRVAALASYEMVGDNKLLKFTFDAPDGTGYTENEATLAENDSGGAVFLNVGGQWKLAGINYAVTGPYRESAGGADFLAALFDTRGYYDSKNNEITGASPVPSGWFASRISTSAATIKGILDLPPTWKTNGDGSWGLAANWTENVVPNAVDAIADFRTVITAERTVSLNSNRTVGTINIDSAPRYTLGGASTLTFNVASGSAAINVASGNHTISMPLVISDPLTLNVIKPTSTLTISGNVTAAGRALTKQGAGVVQLRNLRATSLAVNEGTVTVIPSGTPAGTSKLATLIVADGAALDLTNNMLAVTGGAVGSWNGSAYTGLSERVKSGRDGSGGASAWQGDGINSSAAAANGKTAVGIARAGDVLPITGSQTATWSGQTVDANSVLLKYTYDGDANLDGKINIDDYGRIDSNASKSGTVFGWVNGDFNLDGKINIDDYGIIDTSAASQGAPILTEDPPGALAGVSAVPEPASLGLTFVAAGAFMRRRRR